MKSLIPSEIIERKIYLIRGQKVMLDSELARLYRVTTGNLNKSVDRNLERFPEDFMFRLSKKEASNLMFQNGISSWGGKRKLPRVFTEQGVCMLSGILKSKRAIHVNIAIMRVFVKIRYVLSTHKELVYKLRELEQKLSKHDTEIQTIFNVIKKLMSPTPITQKPKSKIGFLKD